MRKKLRDIWEAFEIRRRRKLAIMNTRGFWVVNVVWFVAGFWFSQLLPARDPIGDYMEYALNIAVIIVFFLPIYWCEILSLSAYFNRQLDRYKIWKHGKRPGNHES